MGGLTIGGKQLFVVLVGLVIMPTVWLDDLSLLSYISASRILASVIIIWSIFSSVTFDRSIGFHGKWTLINWNEIHTAVSLYAFCYFAILIM
ncbi:hypothetical protein Lalb_Chr02g0149851 [Lupinus albus]|uniref:Uncharacterized protein n=1 Tax=Lupinus albus TaxID=3870 RepID=A0A6A4R1A0_LUPAL|nr:hypothetical protein Lalb_Chr02g0149851 [Lupinus albus]